MDVVCQGWYSVWKSFLICNQFACRWVSLHFWPTVVDVDILITGILVSWVSEHVCHLHVKFLIDASFGIQITVCLTGKPYPRHPAHGWCSGQSIVKTMDGWEWQWKDKDDDDRAWIHDPWFVGSHLCLSRGNLWVFSLFPLFSSSSPLDKVESVLWIPVAASL